MPCHFFCRDPQKLAGPTKALQTTISNHLVDVDFETDHRLASFATEYGFASTSHLDCIATRQLNHPHHEVPHTRSRPAKPPVQKCLACVSSASPSSNKSGSDLARSFGGQLDGRITLTIPDADGYDARRCSAISIAVSAARPSFSSSRIHCHTPSTSSHAGDRLQRSTETEMPAGY